MLIADEPDVRGCRTPGQTQQLFPRLVLKRVDDGLHAMSVTSSEFPHRHVAEPIVPEVGLTPFTQLLSREEPPVVPSTAPGDERKALETMPAAHRSHNLEEREMARRHDALLSQGLQSRQQRWRNTRGREPLDARALSAQELLQPAGPSVGQRAGR